MSKLFKNIGLEDIYQCLREGFEKRENEGLIEYERKRDMFYDRIVVHFDKEKIFGLNIISGHFHTRPDEEKIKENFIKMKPFLKEIFEPNIIYQGQLNEIIKDLFEKKGIYIIRENSDYCIRGINVEREKEISFEDKE